MRSFHKVRKKKVRSAVLLLNLVRRRVRAYFGRRRRARTTSFTFPARQESLLASGRGSSASPRRSNEQKVIQLPGNMSLPAGRFYRSWLLNKSGFPNTWGSNDALQRPAPVPARLHQVCITQGLCTGRTERRLTITSWRMLDGHAICEFAAERRSSSQMIWLLISRGYATMHARLLPEQLAFGREAISVHSHILPHTSFQQTLPGGARADSQRDIGPSQPWHIDSGDTPASGFWRLAMHSRRMRGRGTGLGEAETKNQLFPVHVPSARGSVQEESKPCDCEHRVAVRVVERLEVPGAPAPKTLSPWGRLWGRLWVTLCSQGTEIGAGSTSYRRTLSLRTRPGARYWGQTQHQSGNTGFRGGRGGAGPPASRRSGRTSTGTPAHRSSP